MIGNTFLYLHVFILQFYLISHHSCRITVGMILISLSPIIDLVELPFSHEKKSLWIVYRKVISSPFPLYNWGYLSPVNKKNKIRSDSMIKPMYSI